MPKPGQMIPAPRTRMVEMRELTFDEITAVSGGVTAVKQTLGAAYGSLAGGVIGAIGGYFASGGSADWAGAGFTIGFGSGGSIGIIIVSSLKK